MDLTIPSEALSELAAVFLQAGVTIGLALLCALLYERYRKRYFAYWALAWWLYAMRLGAIISFILTEDRYWLYWHQVTTGLTALALLWAALVFSRQLRWRSSYLVIALFPPLWSYLAIYRLDSFLLAAGPAVLFLSAATLWTGWVFFRYHRQVRSIGAASLAVALLLWGLHHLDYPFLRARGVWNPWGYYLDILFVLAMGTGILLLVLEEQHRGIGTLSALSADLQSVGRGSAPDVLTRLLQRPLTLAGVRGSAMYLLENEAGRFVGGAGACAGWKDTTPTGAAARAIAGALDRRQPEIARGTGEENAVSNSSFAYAAALPVLQEEKVRGALVIVGDARDPFAALDTRFLVALGQQVGAALESADLYRRLETRTAELERLAARMVRQHEEERRRLSRELHDETAQVFSAVKLQLGVLREHVDARLQQSMDRVLSLVDDGIRSIRNVTRDLRPALLDDLGLVPALRALVSEFGGQSGVATRFAAPEKLLPLSDEAELAIFRALQEGLANVARHAGAQTVSVELQARPGSILLEVTDDGQGPPEHDLDRLEQRGHMGLAGMRQRISALGGAVSVDGSSGGGLTLRVELPWSEETEGE
jgi:signal transduction histidine kinase